MYSFSKHLGLKGSAFSLHVTDPPAGWQEVPWMGTLLMCELVCQDPQARSLSRRWGVPDMLSVRTPSQSCPVLSGLGFPSWRPQLAFLQGLPEGQFQTLKP